MPQVIFSPGALRNIERLREFLLPKNPVAAERAAEAIIKAILLLEQHPQIGRVIDGTSGKIRDLSIPFGHSGYVARYAFAGADVEILAVRHMREAGFYAEHQPLGRDQSG